jgi:hypothetical protein
LPRENCGQTTVIPFGLKFGNQMGLNCEVKKKVFLCVNEINCIHVSFSLQFQGRKNKLIWWVEGGGRPFKSHKIYFPLIKQVSASSVRNRASIQTDAH